MLGREPECERGHEQPTPEPYDYDAAGNMIYDATTRLHYAYDQENRITGVVPYTYTYDADGSRAGKSNGSTQPPTGTLYWYMSMGIIGESDLAGNLKTEYIFLDGERVARKDFPGKTVSYYFSDHLKTASVVTDPTGAILDESDYFPWGGELQYVNNLDNHYKFTGKERDSETGIDYFGARYYSNGLGRFISADWSVTAQPIPYADLYNPQTLNLYSYVSNNPVLRADSDGHAKDEQLSGKYTVRIDRSNMNDMPNIHLKKGGNEIARGRINPETRQIEWTLTKKGFSLGAGIKQEALQLAEQKGLFEAAAERLAFIRNLRGAGGGGGGGGMARVFIALQLIDMAFQVHDVEKFNQSESWTGLHIDMAGVIHVTDVNKATQILDPGSTIQHVDGMTVTLGEDRVWRDQFGKRVTLYNDKDGTVHIDNRA